MEALIEVLGVLLVLVVCFYLGNVLVLVLALGVPPAVGILVGFYTRDWIPIALGVVSLLFSVVGAIYDHRARKQPLSPPHMPHIERRAEACLWLALLSGLVALFVALFLI